MQQLSIFDVMRRPPVRVPVDPNGHVLQSEPDFTLRLKHPRMAWDRADIEIHQHENGLWMWATGWTTNEGGSGYRVGAKWGKFAETREDAMFYAATEIEDRLKESTNPDALLIIKWASALKDNPEAMS